MLCGLTLRSVVLYGLILRSVVLCRLSLRPAHCEHCVAGGGGLSVQTEGKEGGSADS